MNPIKNSADVRVAITNFHTRFDPKHAEWKRLDAWRTMDVAALENDVWDDLPQNARRRTVAKTDIAAITDTGAAFLIGDEPNYTTIPSNPSSLRVLDEANQVERLADALVMKINEHRPFPLMHAGAEFTMHRGHLVTRRLMLTPEQRGEAREDSVPLVDGIAPGFEQPIERITKEGRFPIQVDHLDPAECYWTLDPFGECIEFYHEYETQFSAAAEMFPQLMHSPKFASYRTAGSYQSKVKVGDYWNSTHNCVLVNDIDAKPLAEHHYTVFPFVIDMAKPVMDDSSNPPAWWGTPFCAPVLEHVILASWADSIIQPYLEIIAYATLVHRGISAQPGKSPYVGVDPETGKPNYLGVADHGPGKEILPGFDDEIWEYLRPPEIVQVLQEFKAQRIRDIQLLTFAEPILTGVYQVGPLSGLSVSQQKVAAMQRLVPRAECMSRHYSRVYSGVVQMLKDEWDRGGNAIVVDLLSDVSATRVQITPQLLDSVAGIEVHMQPKIPVNEQAERQMEMEGVAQNIYSLRSAQERMGVKDPAWEFRQRAYEINAMSNPQMLNAISWEHGVSEGLISKENPYLPPEYAGQGQPVAQPTAPQPGMPQDPRMALQAGMTPSPGAAMPMDPAMAMGMGGPQGMDPAMQMAMAGPQGGGGGPGGEEAILQQMMADPRFAEALAQLGG